MESNDTIEMLTILLPYLLATWLKNYFHILNKSPALTSSYTHDCTMESEL